MAILVNLGQRGFVLKEGLLAPGQSIVVDAETAENFSRTYPKELKVITPEAVKVEEKPAVAKKAEPVQEPEVKEEAVKAPKKRSKRKAK